MTNPFKKVKLQSNQELVSVKKKFITNYLLVLDTAYNRMFKPYMHKLSYRLDLPESCLGGHRTKTFIVYPLYSLLCSHLHTEELVIIETLPCMKVVNIFISGACSLHQPYAMSYGVLN